MRWANRKTCAGLIAVVALLTGASAARAQFPIYRLGVFGQFTRNGMVITVVEPFSPAASIGLRPGDVIVGINGTAIRNQRQFTGVINSSGGQVILGIRQWGSPPGSRFRVALLLPFR